MKNDNPYAIHSSQTEPLYKALDQLQCYQDKPYQRKPSTTQQSAFATLAKRVDGKKWLVDWGCGKGHSTHYLATKHPDLLCIGIDKSIHRLASTRQWSLKNLHFIQGNIIDMILLLHKHSLALPQKQFFFYPNPWPKLKHAKRRFHFHPIFPLLLKTAPAAQMRTNWSIYAEEWALACQHLRPDLNATQTVLEPNDSPISAFERKYFEHGSTCYQVLVD